MNKLQTISPIDGSIYVERDYARPQAIQASLARARDAFARWRQIPIAERKALCAAAVDALVANREPIAEEIAWQMGRPIAHSPFEVAGLEERSRYMIDIAETSLTPVVPAEKAGFNRYIQRDPLGLVFVIAPWNYPYLTAINAIMPALLAGNVVILKHSAQTPLCAERFAEAFQAAGLPEGVFQYLHLTHGDTETLIQAPETDFVAFTGSVAGGKMVEQAAAERFIGVGLELGGKDPAYVRADADLQHAVKTLTDGAFFNAGQSCCGIERVYVAQPVFDQFVEGMAALTRQYRLGRPDDPETTLGPMVRASAAKFVRGQIAEARAAGATAHVDPALFAMDQPGTPYLAPQVLTGVDHSMRVMNEESFGPLVGVMAVTDDDEAVQLMNDSDYGLTASVFTRDEEAAIRIGDRVQTGTWFMNRCDYLDPALAWTGVKHSGRGCTLSSIGFEHLTRPKSYHLKIKT
ncbi:MAG: aldehyde dehydrogenase family protein [Pseudomonadota bacterium]|nr:aldehyde dehydrogenase family protein [Pseudomonadota bacterium]